jgi:hypothetical protein
VAKTKRPAESAAPETPPDTGPSTSSATGSTNPPAPPQDELGPVRAAAKGAAERAARSESKAGARKDRASGEAPASLAPPTKESFDDLAKKVAKAEPWRGSVTQPPPAWEPDEVTLGFAIVNEKSGETRELPEPTVLATILIAVEHDRRGILNRVAASFEEEVDAVANLFWPFLVIHGGGADQAAIFDGTGVWKRTFRYTLMPSMDGIRPLQDASRTPEDYLVRMRALTPYLGRDAGAEILTVEGFLPLDPPLLFDVLSQSRFRSDPQSPHAAFLPARHKVEWYNEEVGQMRTWLDRFENDLKVLGEIRAQIDTILKETERRLGEEYRKAEEAARERAQKEAARADAEVGRLQQSHHAEVQRHLETIRKAQGVIAHSEAAIATSDTLAFRASHRRADPAPHQSRGKQAQNAVRVANRQIGESRRAIEQVHEQQRAAQEQAIAKVAEVERASAQALAQKELFRDEYVAAGSDLLQSIDGQIAARSSQRNLLAGYFLPLPSLASVSVVWFPLWIATLRSSKGVRQIVFPPMQLRAGVGLGGTLKRLFGGIVLPLEPRTAQFDKVLRPTMEEALARDPWLSAATLELARAADILVDPDVLQRFQEGLGELRRQGWISHKQETDFFRSYTDRLHRRAGHGAGVAGAVPTGAKTEGFPDAGPQTPPPTTPP